MSDTQIRFPSGITVIQAKKDAKRVQKTRNCTLSEAQDITSIENGVDLPWNKAVKHLRDSIPFVDIHLGTRRLQLTHDKPIGSLIGFSGCGKSVAALIIAEKHLLEGKDVHWITYKWPENEYVVQRDMSLQQSLALSKKYPNQYYTHSPDKRFFEKKSLFSKFKPKKESLIIVDEAYLISQRFNAEDIVKTAAKFKSGFLLLEQDGVYLENFGWDMTNKHFISFIMIGFANVRTLHSEFYSKFLKDLKLKIKNKISKLKSSEFIFINSNGQSCIVVFDNLITHNGEIVTEELK